VSGKDESIFSTVTFGTEGGSSYRLSDISLPDIEFTKRMTGIVKEIPLLS